MYLKDLKNLESTNLVEDTQQVLSNLHVTQERERKEVKEQIANQARHLNDSMASYQNLIDDLQRSVIVTKIVESVITTARAAIIKVRALIQDDEQKLMNEKEKGGGARGRKKLGTTGAQYLHLEVGSFSGIPCCEEAFIR